MKQFKYSVICTIFAIIDITMLAILQSQKDLLLNVISVEVYTMIQIVLTLGIIALLALIFKWICEIFNTFFKK